jgi:hypothetical protein
MLYLATYLRARRVSVNVVLIPNSETTVRSPSWLCAIFLLMLSPKPFPLGFLAFDSLFLVLKKGTNKFLRSSDPIPMPVSVTEISTTSLIPRGFLTLV